MILLKNKNMISKKDKRLFKSFKVMKLLIIFLFTMGLQAYASDSKTITLIEKNVPLKTVFKEIERQSGFNLIYKENFIKEAGKVSIKVTRVTIEEALNECLKGLPLTYQILKKTIVIKEKPLPLSVNSSLIPKQIPNRVINGTVNDNEGNSLSGVSVTVKGTQRGTRTDQNGKFSIDANEGDVLEFTYIGFSPQEITYNGQSPLLVKLLKKDITAMDEVVVVGYGTTRKKDLTGATSVLSGKDLATQSNISVGSALQGKMSGINIQSSSGFPGSATSISIRGVGTFGTGDNSPLVVIDGVPVDAGFETLNPADIENVTVLKDASSAAIYGSRAANGVILITTKKGSSKGGALSLNVNYGVQSPAHVMDLLSAEEFVSAIQEMSFNKRAIDGGNATSNYEGHDPASFGKGTVWSDYIYRTAPTFDINGSVSGGDEKSRYYISSEFLNQEGIGINTGYKKGSLRTNLETTFAKRLTIGNNMHVAFRKTNGNSGIRYSDVIFNAPVTPAYDADGSYGEPHSLTGSKNAIPEVIWNSAINDNYRLLDNVYLQYKFTDWLKFRFNGGVDMVYNEYKSFNPLYNDGGQTNNQNSLSDQRRKELMWVTDYLLYFDKSISNHTINAMGGFSQQLFTRDNLNGTTRDFISEVENMQVIDGGTNTINRQVSGGKSELALRSWFGRINYDFDSRYLLSFNLRADASSRFKGANRWGYFPSLSGAWRISSEEFFKVKNISDLKLRASWGQLGNQSIGSWYPTSAALNKQNSIFGTSGNEQLLYSGYGQTALGNNNLRWETTKVTNIGLDLALLNGKVSVTIDAFNKETDGILRSMVLPISVGMTSPNVNFAKVRNRGIDLEVGYKGKINDFSFTVAGNVSVLKNEILQLSAGVTEELITLPYGGLSINRVGESISSLYGYKTTGVITTEKEAKELKQMGQGNAKVGRLAYEDINGDGKINGNDRTILGSFIPKYTAGLSLSGRWNSFDFSSVLVGVFGRKQHSPMSFQNRMPNRNMSRKWYDNRWTIGSDPAGKYPALIQSESYEEMTDLMVSNTSFIKMKSLSLGYTYPIKGIKMRLYASAENLFTITHKDFDGFDPENGNAVGHYTNWGGDYPTARIFLAGLNINF